MQSNTAFSFQDFCLPTCINRLLCQKKKSCLGESEHGYQPDMMKHQSVQSCLPGTDSVEKVFNRASKEKKRLDSNKTQFTGGSNSGGAWLRHACLVFEMALVEC